MKMEVTHRAMCLFKLGKTKSVELLYTYGLLKILHIVWIEIEYGPFYKME